jgi:hypothetical protein
MIEDARFWMLLHALTLRAHRACTNPQTPFEQLSIKTLPPSILV